MNLLIPMGIGFLIFLFAIALWRILRGVDRRADIRNAMTLIEVEAANVKTIEELNYCLDKLFDFYNKFCSTNELRWRAMEICAYIRGRKDGIKR